MEQLIKREMRSKDACELINKFISLVENSRLPENEKLSLGGALGYLQEQSFSSAFSSFSKQLTSPKEINGMPTHKFVSECIKFRNKLAHHADANELRHLEEYTKHLRDMVSGIMWSRYNFPEISVYRPSHTIEIEKMEIRTL